MNFSFCLLAYALGGEITDMVGASGLVAKAVLLILLVFSLMSWAIIFAKWGLFRRARLQSNRFVRAFRKSTRIQDISAVAEQFKPSPLVAVFEGHVQRIAQAGADAVAYARRAACRTDRLVGRADSPGEPLALAGNDGSRDPVHRPLRHGVGHHRRLSRIWAPQELRPCAPLRREFRKRSSPPPPDCSPPFPRLSLTTRSCSRFASSARAWTTSAWS